MSESASVSSRSDRFGTPEIGLIDRIEFQWIICQMYQIHLPSSARDLQNGSENSKIWKLSLTNIFQRITQQQRYVCLYLRQDPPPTWGASLQPTQTPKWGAHYTLPRRPAPPSGVWLDLSPRRKPAQAKGSCSRSNFSISSHFAWLARETERELFRSQLKMSRLNALS